MDEHRIGLKPIRRRVWSPRGERPIVPVHQRYQWLYVYGFVRPTTGQTMWLLMPTVSVEAWSVALAEFARTVGLGPSKRIDLVVDCAGWHTSPRVERPTGLQLLFLPPYSPELQPAEHLWALSDRPLLNRCFETLDALEAVQADHCRWLEHQTAIVRSTTNFHWWPQLA